MHELVSKCHTGDVKETKIFSLSRFLVSGLFRDASHYKVGNAFRHLAGHGRADLTGQSSNQEQIFLNFLGSNIVSTETPRVNTFFLATHGSCHEFPLLF